MGLTYWEYVLIYVDDILVISEKPTPVMETLEKLYRLKTDPHTGGKYDVPDVYLGTGVGNFNLRMGPNRVGTCLRTNTYARQWPM